MVGRSRSSGCSRSSREVFTRHRFPAQYIQTSGTRPMCSSCSRIASRRRRSVRRHMPYFVASSGMVGCPRSPGRFTLESRSRGLWAPRCQVFSSQTQGAAMPLLRIILRFSRTLGAALSWPHSSPIPLARRAIPHSFSLMHIRTRLCQQEPKNAQGYSHPPQ